MSKEILFYGERGILNSIILDMQGDISKQKKFLKSIVLGDKSKLTWVDDVCIFRYVIEPNLEDFGTPNFIIEAITKSDDKYVLFVQGKINSYEENVAILNPVERLNNDYLPQNYRNTNKLNIQLAILYRFIKCYKSTEFNSNSRTGIKEKEEVARNYNDDIGRTLSNKIIINYWNKHYKDVKEYYFVALTNDSKKIMDDDNIDTDMFPYNNDNMIPPIGNKQWEKDKNKFGILTYDTLLDKNVILKNMGYYKNTSELMWFEPPMSSFYHGVNQAKPLVTINTDRWSENQETLSNLLKDIKDLDEDFKLFVKDFISSVEYQ